MPKAAREPEFGTSEEADGALLAALTGAVYVEPARVLEGGAGVNIPFKEIVNHSTYLEAVTETEERAEDDEVTQEASSPVILTCRIVALDSLWLAPKKAHEYVQHQTTVRQTHCRERP